MEAQLSASKATATPERFQPTTKNVESLVFGIMQHLFRPADWSGLSQAYFKPIASKLFVAGAADGLMRHAAAIPGSDALRKLHLYKSSIPRTKDLTEDEELAALGVGFEQISRLEQLGLSIPQGLRIELPDWLQDRMKATLDDLFSYDYWEAMGEQIGDDVGRVLINGITDGKSIGQIATELQQAVPAYTRQRAVLVARTESAGLLNAGAIASFEELNLRSDGLLGTKTWLSVLDERTRPAHVEANGQTQKLGDPFTVDGETCQYPGDPSLSAGQRCHCRCTVIASDTISDADETG